MRDPDPSATHPFEIAIAAAFAGVLVIALWTWATAALAGLVFGAANPAIDLGESFAAAKRLPGHLGDPRVAFEASARTALPGAFGFWLAAAVVTAAAVAVAAIVLRIGRALTAGRRSRTAAAWASARDLRSLRVRGATAGRIPLGRHGRHRLAAEPGQSAIVVAPTQTGKTTGLAIPALLEWRGPVLATSVKTDLLRDTIDARRASGGVRLFDPAGETGLECANWTPLMRCGDWAIARRTAAWLAEGASAGKRALATLYLSSTVREQRRLRPLFVALIQSVVQAAYEGAAATGRPLDPPLLIVLDEAANIAPLPDLDVLASTGAGQGIQLLTVLQDLAQAHDRWGHDRAATIVNNHRAKLIGAGASDPRTLEWVSRLLGEEELDQRSSTAGDGRHSETRSVTFRSMAPANVVRQGRPGTAVLVNGNLPPSWIQLRPWFRDRRLRALVHRAHSREKPRSESR